MAREIKFRGKAAGEWHYGHFFAYRNTGGGTGAHFIVLQEAEDANLKPIQVMPETVGQFTGLHDKNGREIYEGDILRGDCYPYHDDGVDNYLGVVFYADDDHMWEVIKFVTAKSDRSGISNFINDAFYEIDFSKMEVIGNLWDNKGLFRDSDEDIMKWFNG